MKHIALHHVLFVLLFTAMGICYIWLNEYYFQKRKAKAKRLTVDEIKKIQATGPPQIVSNEARKLADLNRGQRRRLLKQISKDKESYSSKLKNEKGRIMDARDFLDKYGIDKKIFDGK